jgi:pectin methylesterase-like acyl-CoA thioesterase
MGLLRKVATATIAINQSLSNAISVGNGMLAGIQMPAGWDAAALSFQVSHDGITYADLYVAAGTEVSITTAASRYIALDQSTWNGVQFLKVRSGLTAAAVNQTAARSILLISAPVGLP